MKNKNEKTWYCINCSHSFIPQYNEKGIKKTECPRCNSIMTIRKENMILLYETNNNNTN